MIYFDNASTTKTDLEVEKKFLEYNEEYFANPSSVHELANSTNKMIEKSKLVILNKLNLNKYDYEVIFTSGATESNNLAIKGFYSRKNENSYIVTSAVEHPSIENTVLYINENFEKAIFVPCVKDGLFDYDELENILKTKKVSMITVMLVNNELGDILNLQKIRNLIDKYDKNIVLFSDTTQAIGKIKFDYSILDMMSLSFHKIKGFKGCGILIKRKNIKLDPILVGGGQQNNIRSGTMNAPMYLANAFCLQLAINNFETHRKNASQLKKYIVEKLQNVDEVHINTDLENSSDFILNFSLLKTKASVVVEALSNREIYVSTTSACSSHKTKFSKTVNCKFNDKHISENSIRLSFDGTESLDSGVEFVRFFKEILNDIKR